MGKTRLPRTRGGGVGGRGREKGGERCRTYGVVVTEAEAESIDFVKVDWVGIKDPNIHLPFFVVVGGDEADAWGERLMDLGTWELEKVDLGRWADVNLPW